MTYTKESTFQLDDAVNAIDAVNSGDANRKTKLSGNDYILNNVARGMIPARSFGMDTSSTDLARETSVEDERMFRGLGHRVQAGQSTADILNAIGLDWEPMLSNIRYGGMFQHLVDSDQVLYRPDGQFLGVVPRGWYDSSQSFGSIIDTFTLFCDEAGITLEQVGKLERMANASKGTNTRLDLTLFAVASIGQDSKFTLPGNDMVTGKLILKYPYIYGKGINVSEMAIRKICTNGMTMPVRLGSKVITHRSAVNHDRIVSVLNQARDCWGEYKETAEVLSQTAIDVPTAMLKLIETFGTPGLKLKEQPKVVQEVLERFEAGAYTGGSMLSAYNTAWGLLNAVTEHFNWNMKGSLSNPARTLQGLMSTDAGSRNGQQLAFLNNISSFATKQKQRQAVSAW